MAQANRQPRTIREQANEQGSMDFMSDSLADHRGFRTLNKVDDATRECMALEVDSSLSGLPGPRPLDEERGAPSRIVIDNGQEFTSKVLDPWAYRHSVELVSIRPGKPIENAFVESFNGRFREECLDVHWFESLADEICASDVRPTLPWTIVVCRPDKWRPSIGTRRGKRSCY